MDSTVSALEEDIKKLKETIRCSLCLSDLRAPCRTLPCNHFFCKECVANLIIAGTSKAKCPLCNHRLPTKRSLLPSEKASEIVECIQSLSESFDNDLASMDKTKPRPQPKRATTAKRRRVSSKVNADPYEFDLSQETSLPPPKPASFASTKRQKTRKSLSEEPSFTALMPKLHKNSAGTVAGGFDSTSTSALISSISNDVWPSNAQKDSPRHVSKSAPSRKKSNEKTPLKNGSPQGKPFVLPVPPPQAISTMDFDVLLPEEYRRIAQRREKRSNTKQRAKKSLSQRVIPTNDQSVPYDGNRADAENVNSYKPDEIANNSGGETTTIPASGNDSLSDRVYNDSSVLTATEESNNILKKSDDGEAAADQPTEKRANADSPAASIQESVVAADVSSCDETLKPLAPLMPTVQSNDRLFELANCACAVAALNASCTSTSTNRLSSGYWAPLSTRQIGTFSAEPPAVVSANEGFDDECVKTQPLPGVKQLAPIELAPDTQLVDGDAGRLTNEDKSYFDDGVPTVVPDSETFQPFVVSESLENVASFHIHSIETQEDVERLRTSLMIKLAKGVKTVVEVHEIRQNDRNNSSLIMDEEGYPPANAGNEHEKEDTENMINSGDALVAVADCTATCSTTAIFSSPHDSSINHKENESEDLNSKERTLVLDDAATLLADSEKIIASQTVQPSNEGHQFADKPQAETTESAPCFWKMNDDEEKVPDDEYRPIATSNNFSTNQEHSYSSQDSSRIVFCISGFSFGPASGIICKFMNLFEAEHQETYSSEVTHVVVNAERKDGHILCTRRTKTYLRGIAGRKWVVSAEWIEQSVRHERVLPPETFEIEGDMDNGAHCAPRLARLATTRLLPNVAVYLHGPFSPESPECFLSELVRGADGKVFDSIELLKFEEKRSSRCCLVLAAKPKEEKTNGEVTNAQEEIELLYAQYKLPIVSVEWLLVCINGWNRVPYEEYLLCSLDEFDINTGNVVSIIID